MERITPRVHGVVAAYRADPRTVVDNLRDCARQLAGVFIVDNSDNMDAGRWADAQQLACPVHTILNGRNLGTAGAFNQGIRAAQGAGAELVLLLDDDTRPGTDMVKQLVTAWKELRVDDAPVAAVGPDFQDRHGAGKALFVQLDGIHLRRIPCSAGAVIRSEYLMSSGSLIDFAALKEVGLLDEELFIDYVDTEWCMRARNRGFNCYGVCTAHMEHSFGERQLHLRWMPSIGIPYRSPIRHYYIFRNALLLMRRTYVPARWKLTELKRLVLLLPAYVSSAPSPLRHLRCMLIGVIHGIAGRAGPAPPKLGQ